MSRNQYPSPKPPRSWGESETTVKRAKKVMKDNPVAHEAAKRGDKKPRTGGRLDVPEGKTAEGMCRDAMSTEQTGPCRQTGPAPAGPSACG